MRFMIFLAGLAMGPISASAEVTDSNADVAELTRPDADAVQGHEAAPPLVAPEAVAAIEAADSAWGAAYALAVDDPVTTDLLTWMHLRSGRAPFAAYREFLTRRPDWPQVGRLRAAGERAIPKGHDQDEVIAWFDGAAPQTGQGLLRLAEALTTSGKIEEAEEVLRAGWLTLALGPAEQNALVSGYRDVLAPLHQARADAMLWRGRRTDAERMLPLLAAEQRAVAAARIGYIRGLRNMLPLYDAVSARLRDTPGFAYQRYTWMAARGNWDEAVEIALERSTSAEALGEPEHWAGWRDTLARWEMREGRAEQAYELASRHFLTEGGDFAELEWISGYLALIYLGDPVTALEHFENAAAVVQTPISLGRMHYWAGRAQEVLGNPEAAAEAYAEAAQYQTAFYGLLAADRLGQTIDPVLVGAPVEWQGAPVFDHDLTKAALTLLAAGQRGHAVSFIAELGRQLDPEALAQLGAYLTETDQQYYALLLGKTAAARGVVVPSIYFPLHDLAEMELPVEPALALAVARRESEFNIGIGSPAGALGLMQLMPGTAREVAGFLGMPYVQARLTTDWEYNAILGSKYLSILQAEFGQSPVMIAAGYNAGPSRPNIWMDERGDPRLGEMDVIDWIEHIPFTETRNYVMRVTEAIPIYRARLSGEAGPLRFEEMLIGSKPLLRPRVRPLPQVVGETPDVRPMTRPEQG